MNKQTLNSFLTEMFKNHMEFASINGTANSMDSRYMLVADAISENIELLEDVLKEHFEYNLNSVKNIKVDKKRTPCSYAA